MLASLLFAGCSGDSSRPKDLPPLFPAEITITQQGTPLAGATVALVAFGGTSSVYYPAGITDESGKAVISTYGFNGAPAGTYKVTVRKTIVDDVKKVIDAYGDMVDGIGIEYRTVERQYSDAETTPHEIEIVGKSTPPALFDVGKPVKIKK